MSMDCTLYQVLAVFSLICSAGYVVEKEQQMKLKCNKECNEGGMDETLSDGDCSYT